jgi:hypothetical protein
VREVLADGWDLMIAHPPCTHLAVSGARWFKDKQVEQAEALAFVTLLLKAPIKKKALENPISIISSRIRKPNQIIQPWMFGHPQSKATCLWLENLPDLIPTKVITYPQREDFEFYDAYDWAIKQWHAVHRAPPGPDRWKFRSRTFQGIANAMAEQWG